MAHLLLLGRGAAAFEIIPEAPTVCDDVTIVVHRSFAADCMWRAIPSVRVGAEAIEVDLELRGETSCDAVMTDQDFRVPIGSLTAGDHVIVVRWSDDGSSETASVSVSHECR